MPLHILDNDCTLHRPVVSPLHPPPQGLRHRNLERSYHINQKLGALGRCLICLLLLQGSPTFLTPRAISRLLSNIFDTNLHNSIDRPDINTSHRQHAWSRRVTWCPWALCWLPLFYSTTKNVDMHCTNFVQHINLSIPLCHNLHM